MRADGLILAAGLLAASGAAPAASPGNAPPLPMAGTRVVNVATEAELQTAMGNLQQGEPWSRCVE